MRIALSIPIAAAVFIAGPSSARATCDGCCDVRFTLIGWSDSGATYAYIADYGELELEADDGKITKTREQALVVIDLGVQVEFLVDGDQVGNCIAGSDGTPVGIKRTAKRTALERVDVRTHPRLKDYGLRPFAAGTASTLRSAVRVAQGPKRQAWFDNGLDTCSTWDLYRGSVLLARLPRECSATRDLGHSEIRGGFVHPAGEFALVKLRESRMGYRTTDRFRLISLRQTAPEARTPASRSRESDVPPAIRV